MGKQIITTLLYAVIVFVGVCVLKYSEGVEYWLMESLDWVVPLAIGYFSGYQIARTFEKNEK